MSNRKKPTGTPSVKDWLAGAKLPETTVQVCLQADLVAELEQAEADLAAARNTTADSLAGSGVEQITERIHDLQERMRAGTRTFKLKAMPRPAWRAFVAEHPPRQDADGGVDVRDRYIGANTETLWPALIQASVYEPALDGDDWTLLLDELLTDRQFNDLAEAAWNLNRGAVSVPFSRAASKTTPNSGDE